MWAQRGKKKIKKIINVHFAFSEEELPCVQKSKQVCVRNCSEQRKRSNGNLVFLCSFFMCIIDMNKLFEKHL